MAVSKGNERPVCHVFRGRPPSALKLLGPGTGFLALALAVTDMSLILLPLIAYGAVTAYFVVVDPDVGLEVDSRAIRFRGWSKKATVPTAEIDHVHVMHRSDTASMSIHCRDGGVVDVPRTCLPDFTTLLRALRETDLKVITG